MDDESPYQEEPATGVDRRTFVKGVVGAATAGVIGAAGFGMFKQAAIVDPVQIINVNYLGAKVLPGSPAPRGVPYIPVRVNDEGFVEGVPEYLNWYRYCSHESAPGLADPAFTDDNTLEYFLTEEKVTKAGAAAPRFWFYHDKLEQPIRAADFDAQPYGTGAAFRWRSQGQSGNDIITGILLKIRPEEFEGISEEDLADFMDMDHHLIGVSSFCTHFCCVPGWKEDPTAEKYGAWDMIFCTCHNSRYDPRLVTKYSFDLRLAPEGEEDSGGGGGH